MIQNEVNILIKDEGEVKTKYKSIFSSWNAIKKNSLRNILVGLNIGFISGYYYSDILIGIELGLTLSVLYTIIR